MNEDKSYTWDTPDKKVSELSGIEILIMYILTKISYSNT